MEIIEVNHEFNYSFPKKLAACIGYFDGLHLGHQKLIKNTLNYALENNCASALISFDPDPKITIFKMQDNNHLLSKKQKNKKIADFGFDYLIILKFDLAMSKLSKGEFLSKILLKLNLVHLVCGFDFHYGYKGQGNSYTLKTEAKKYFTVDIVDVVTSNNQKVSSTLIKEKIKIGEIMEANKLLGWNYQLLGKVIAGKKIGSKLGFPTANLAYCKKCILPKKGVYYGFLITKQQKEHCVINVGHNPTCNYSQEISVEAHMLNVNYDLYDQEITLEFIGYLRDEKKFSNINDLKEQLQVDCLLAQDLFKSIGQ